MNKRERDGDGTKKSIERVCSLYADVDTVKNGWSTEDMIKRVHSIPGVLRPSACVNSGGGLHLYWFLNAMIDPEWAENVNIQLRNVFAGDAIQNVDRILRLPGTFNTKRKPAKRVEVVWCYGFDRKDIAQVEQACRDAKKWIGEDGEWGAKGAIVKNSKPVDVDPVDTFASVYGEGKRGADKSIANMWENRVRYHAPRGYIGIHEAALVTTAQLYIANKDMPEQAVVDSVMRRIRIIKDRDAPDEEWDMKAEADNVLKMYRTWQPKWKAYVAEKKAERKTHGKSNGLRGTDRRLPRTARRA